MDGDQEGVDPGKTSKKTICQQSEKQRKNKMEERRTKIQTHTQKEDVQLILRARMGKRKMGRERRNT